MNTIDYFGSELVLKPVDKVRVRFAKGVGQSGVWCVEYRTKKWLFSFWSVEGLYRDFVDAKARALTIKSQGGFFILQPIKLEWEVGETTNDDQPPMDQL